MPNNLKTVVGEREQLRGKSMPEISIQKQCASLDDLVKLEPQDAFGEDPLKQFDSGFFEDGNYFAGTWECEPGTSRIEMDCFEFCHLLKGHWKLTSDSGQVTELKPGDSWVFPKGWKGTGEVVETVRKAYFLIT